MFCFFIHWRNKLKLDWVHISADRKTYLMPLIASLVYKANSIFEVYFYIKMLSKFHTSFFSKTCLLENLAPRVLCLFELKVGLSPSKKVFFICFNDRSSKMMKNAFYFNLKALFVLKIFQFLSWLFKAGVQHTGFSASADFFAGADFSAYPPRNFHHNADC